MKIAILTCGILPIPAVQGGAVENLIDFYLEYNNQKKIHDITIFSPWDANVKSHSALSSDVNHYIYIKTTSFKARIARRLYSYLHHNEYYNHFIEYYFEKIYSIIKYKEYDCILLENCPGYTYKLSQRGFNNLILHLHNDLLNSTTRFHDNIACSLTKVITVSNFIKQRVSTIFPLSNIKTVYNGIDTKNFATSKSTKVNRTHVHFSDSDFVIVYSGRTNKDKGVAELISAMLLLKDYTNIKLIIIGGSFFDNAHEDDEFILSLKVKAKKMRDRIAFTGFIPYKEVPNYLQLADIAVLPSMWEEPFGLTIVEALAAGLPLITTRSGGIPEICEGIATIVDKENVVNNLATAILDLYQHPEKREQMAKASIERARLFDKETFARNFFEALENI
jgi:glycosyltransferase involved in cell wall biosynthesis